jgi:glutamate 5-kinase
MSAGRTTTRTIVVKVGSAVLASGGVLEVSAVRRLAEDIRGVLSIAARHRVVIVSSGAVASGFRELGLDTPPREMMKRQAAAAVGQPRLMSAYADAFSRAGKHAFPPRPVAQVLLTAEDIDHRTRFLNARNTLRTLLDAGVVPIINENDSVSFAEIKLGDNDHLSAMVAGLIGADLLLILSSVGGVWDIDGRHAKPAQDATPTIVPEIRSLREALRHVQTDQTSVGTGGMATKVRAACTAAALGASAVIADGRERGIVSRLAAGEAIGTWFPASKAAGSRKQWIGYSARPKGSIVLDEGAARAICQRGASLLPSGVREVRGDFDAGALVELLGPTREPVARGLSAYAADELRLIAGKRSRDIASILGYCYGDEAVHRNDLMLVETSTSVLGDGARS